MSKSKNKNKQSNKVSGKKSTVATIQKKSKVESIFSNIIALFVFIPFGYLAIMSMIQTSKIDPAKYANEVILYTTDNIPLNIFFTVLFFVFLFAMKKHYDFFAKINIKYMEIGLTAYTLILGIIWVLSVQSVPAADSQNIFEAATNAANDNYNSMINGANFYNKDFYGGYSYFNFFPFQLGFVFICEIIYRIFGTSSAIPLEIINAICVALSYLALAKITKLVFKKLSVEFIAIMLLAGCFQPILFSSFAYGNIIALCCGLWSVYFLIRYMQSSKYLLLIPCGLLLVISTLAKYNNMIYIVAFVMVLIIHTIKAKKWQSIAFALAICIAAVGASSLVVMNYESRANVKFNDGVPQSLFLNVGLSESYMAPGWYSTSAKDTYLNSNFNTEVSNKIAWQRINSRLNAFSNASYCVDFFGKKILSQWNEPTYESIWVSKVKSHYSDINAIGEGMYNHSLGQFFELYFNWYMQIIFLLFAVGIYCMFLNKNARIETILLPLIILGGFAYHLLFEGKSQYALNYIPLLIPTCAYAISCLLNGKYTKIKGFIAKLKEIPQKDKEKA